MSYFREQWKSIQRHIPPFAASSDADTTSITFAGHYLVTLHNPSTSVPLWWNALVPCTTSNGNILPAGFAIDMSAENPISVKSTVAGKCQAWIWEY